jgi:hypothetical protein
MDTVVTPTSMQVFIPDLPLSKLEQERRAFLRLLPDLIPLYRGQYVAIHNQQVADHGSSRLEVALRVLKIIGNQDIYVGLVHDQPEPIGASGVRR